MMIRAEDQLGCTHSDKRDKLGKNRITFHNIASPLHPSIWISKMKRKECTRKEK